MSLRRVLPLLLMGFLVVATTGGAWAQAGGPDAPAVLGGTGFTYQGELNKTGSPVTATCDFQFSLFDDSGAGTQVGSTETETGVGVTNGRFTVILNDTGLFGARAFDGSARWLAVAVKCPPDGGFTPLIPRQALTAAPLALALPGLRTEIDATSPNLIGGYISNTVTGGVVGAAIGGGGLSGNVNSVTGNFGTVGGGVDNTAYQLATVGGGTGNSATGVGDTVGGGESNTTSLEASTVGGGSSNTASGNYATIGGGQDNTASGEGATVGGGGWDGSTFGGNKALGAAGTVGGGLSNVVSPTATYGTVAGGRQNTASGANTTVSGGFINTATAPFATVGGGVNNIASGLNAVVGGGSTNVANGQDAVVGGGVFDTASAQSATVGGGRGNTASATRATVGGGQGNIAGGVGATVAGGGYNGVVAIGNRALGLAGSIGGGYANVITATADYGTVGGGRNNVVTGTAAYGTVSGGISNTVSGNNATVPGGQQNTASGAGGAVGGGFLNTASGANATVPGGQQNSASGNYSFAAGLNSNAAHQGTFVWTCTTCSATSSSAADQFIANAAGGFWFGGGGSTTGPVGSISAGQLISTSTNAYLSTAGVWTDVSDRNAKMNFASVSGPDLLEALMGIPVQSWTYKVDAAGARHIGPTAQDFYAAFGVGEDDTHLAALDTSGVALAAIQSLYTVVQEKDTQIAALSARVAALETLMSTEKAGLATAEGETPQQGVSTGTGAGSAAALPWLLLAGLGLLNVGGLAGYLLARAKRA